MIYLIVGHRGAGKTLWLEKVKTIFADFEKKGTAKQLFCFLDLDREIEKKTGRKVSEFFSGDQLINALDVKRIRFSYTPSQIHSKNKKYFRLQEKETLNELIDKYKITDQQVFIAVGAGFKSKLKKDRLAFCRVIHLIRETDPLGRVFLNRPGLNINNSPYKEYISLYPEREKFYQKIRDENFVLPEWDFEFDKPENLLFNLKPAHLNSILTLNKNSLPARRDQWPAFINKRLSWGLRFFELRDDQLSANEFSVLLQMIPKEKQLLSLRKAKSSELFKQDLSSFVYDWPLEKGPPSFCPPVLSLHKRKKESFKQLCGKLLKHKASHFKLAVPVNNFKELMQGHLWFLEDPEHRSFLPVSGKGKEGKWRWYRQIVGPQMKLHFIKESRSGISDQPFLYEHLLFLNANNQNKQKASDPPGVYEYRDFFSGKKQSPCLFSAILGDPVIHSASPAFHKDFFAQWGMVFTKIPMSEKEFTKENLCILRKMGLVFAAVTSPLKKKALQICDTADSSALSFRSVNTLIFKNRRWFGGNTDEYGLQALLTEAGIKEKEGTLEKESSLGKSHRNVVVWGGGGMKRILEKQLPFARFYSARTARERNKASVSSHQSHTKGQQANPHTVVWAVGRSRMPACVFPKKIWKPRLVVDLNYTEDSPGLEYALLTGAEYISGKVMFQNQADRQQNLFLRQ